MGKLLFGTSGIPSIAKGSTTMQGVAAIRALNLDAMELAFVHSVNISEEKAPLVRAAADENSVTLTCHGQYYINLNADDAKKFEASKFRLYNAAKIANLCGATSVTFHPGFYLKSSREECYKKISGAIKEVVEKLKADSNPITVRPETTGRHKQFGNLQETLQLCADLGILPCIDYAHMRAREGKNNREQFAQILEEIENILGKSALKSMHIQFSGVNFTENGERNHLTLKSSDLKYEEMVQTWKDFKIEGIIISESPNQEEDALLIKRIYEEL